MPKQVLPGLPFYLAEKYADILRPKGVEVEIRPYRPMAYHLVATFSDGCFETVMAEKQFPRILRRADDLLRQ